MHIRVKILLMQYGEVSCGRRLYKIASITEHSALYLNIKREALLDVLKS